MGKAKLRKPHRATKKSSPAQESAVTKEKLISKKGKKIDKKNKFLKHLETQRFRGDATSSSMLSQLEASLKPKNDNKKDAIRPAGLSIIKSNSMKKTVAIRESERLRLVQQHPQFIANPIEAVRMHINHMISTKEASKM